MNYEQKYLKYKNKYLDLKNQIGSGYKFMKAVKEGNYNVVKEKLVYMHGWSTKYADPNQIEKSTGKRAVQYAIELNYLDILILLTNYGGIIKNEDIELILKQSNKRDILFKLLDDEYRFSENQIKLIETTYNNFQNLINLYNKKNNLINKRNKLSTSNKELNNTLSNGYSGGMMMPATTAVTAIAYHNLRNNNREYLSDKQKEDLRSKIDINNELLKNLNLEIEEVTKLIKEEKDKMN
jgi:hypothetical protein